MKRPVSAMLIVAGALTLAGGAAAQTFPTKPIRIIVPYAAGGSDAQLRPMAQCLQADLGQPIVIENIPGANGAVGSSQVARSAADGHTLLYPNTAAMTLAPKLGTIPYSPNDFTPIVQLIYRPLVLAARKESPYQNLKDLIAAAKAKPSEISFGSAGLNSTSHMATEALLARVGIKLLHVPYTGEVPAVTSVLNGTTTFTVTAPQSIMPQVLGGKMVALGSTGKERFALTPDVPTMREQGFDGVDVIARMGIFAPKGTPEPVMDKIGNAFSKCAKDEAYKNLMKGVYNDVVYMEPKQFRASLVDEGVFYDKLIATMGIKPAK